MDKRNKKIQQEEFQKIVEVGGILKDFRELLEKSTKNFWKFQKKIIKSKKTLQSSIKKN